MARFIWHNNQWVPAVRAVRVSAFPAIIRDQMDATWHPATGELVESKSAFRAITKARGYEEVGNDTAPLFERPPPAPDPTLERDIAQAWEMVEQGYRPDPCDTAETDTRMIEAV